MTPISVTGKSKRTSTGFTLIEILVVLVIIATMAGLLMISLGGNPARDVQREAKRLRHLFQLAGDEAVLQGVEIGWIAEPEQYRFVRYDPDELTWQPIERKPFQPHVLPENLELRLSLDNKKTSDSPMETDAVADWLEAGEEKDNLPQLLFLSSGISSPFVIELSARHHDDIYVELESDGVNEIWVN